MKMRVESTSNLAFEIYVIYELRIRSSFKSSAQARHQMDHPEKRECIKCAAAVDLSCQGTKAQRIDPAMTAFARRRKGIYGLGYRCFSSGVAGIT
jgi:hypothetical protein